MNLLSLSLTLPNIFYGRMQKLVRVESKVQ